MTLRLAAIVVLVFVLLATAGVGGFAASRFRVQSAESRPVQLPPCASEEVQKEVREILMGGLREALNDRVTSLFEVWMKDPTDQPGRAKTGIDRSVAAYVHGREAIAKWSLPKC